jgi:hypothetical protein
VAAHPLSNRAVLYEPPIIRYRIDGNIMEEHPLGALRRVIHVYVGSDLNSNEMKNDMEFDLLDFGESIWIVPDDISFEPFTPWADYLRAVDGYFKASIVGPPSHWLTRGFLGLGRRPAATVLRGETLPSGNRIWMRNGPIDPVTHQPLYPVLRSLISGYFNQDWDIISKTEDPDEVIAIVKQETSPEGIHNLINDIERFVAKYGQSDSELNDALERVFQPEVDFYNMKDRTTREGLQKAIEILSNSPTTP